MVSQTEKGKRFQERCRDVLQLELGRPIEMDVSIQTKSGKARRYDLATKEGDVVAECKAYAWTVSGNVPSAKIAHLKEAVQNLRELASNPALYLIVKRDMHPRRKETLAAYFVRLYKDFLGPVNVLEMPEAGGELSCVHGKVGSAQRGKPASGPGGPSGMTVAELGEIRRSLFKLLDCVEGRRSRDEGPGKRVTRLRAENKIPRNIANLMHTVLGFRDAAEYEEYMPTPAEVATIKSAWQAIIEWGETRGWHP